MNIRKGDITSQLDIARGQRLATAMRNSNCKRAVLASFCNVSERQVTRWRHGDRIADHHLDTITSRCEISREYLLFGDVPGLPATINVSPDVVINAMTDGENSINKIKLHPLHVHLIRHIRLLPEGERAAVLDRIINNRWASEFEPFKSGAASVDDVLLDRYEIAAILALRAIENPGREISLINQIICTKLQN